MQNIFLQRNGVWLVFALAFWAFTVVPLNAKDAKMKADELVAKHLASIGTPEAIAAVRSRSISGRAQAIFRLPKSGLFDGSSAVLSEGRRLGIRMIFYNVDYPWEELAYDGRKVTVNQVRPGERSSLSEFVYQRDFLMKEGLLGGTMTTAWALLDVARRAPKLEYTGIEQFEGKRLHEVKYGAQTGPTDIQISLYFEQGTFRHLHTRIRLVEFGGMENIPKWSQRKINTAYTLVESYGDFRPVDSLSLPHTYKLVQMIDAQDLAILVEYIITAERILHNQALDPKSFRVP